jgi:integrase/recombinase XerD
MTATITEASAPEALTFLARFLDMMAIERGAAPNTLMAYTRDLKAFLEKVPEGTTASGQDIATYLQTLTLSPRSRSRAITALRQFFLFLQTEGLRPDNPTKTLKTPAAHRPIPHYFTEDQMGLLFAWFNNPITPEDKRLLAMIELLYGVGLRASELVCLPFSALMHQGEALLVTGKGGKERLLPLTLGATKALQAYKEVRGHFLVKPQNPFMFPGNSRQGHVSRQQLDLKLKDLAAKVGLPSLSAHMLRHSLATHLLHRGVDLPTLQAILRHEDLSTTQIYTHIPEDHLRQTLQTCHPLGQHDGTWERRDD